MKLKRILLSSVLISASLSADIFYEGISTNEGLVNYTNPVFNTKINMSPSRCSTIKEIFNEIEVRSGFEIINNTNLDESKAICDAYKYEYAGTLIDRLVDTNNITYRAKEPNQIIVEYPVEYSEKFPMNWNIEKSMNMLKNKYSNINITSFGNTIQLKGNKEFITEAKNTLKTLNKWATREIGVIISLSKLNTDKIGTHTIGKIKKNAYKRIKTIMKHSNMIALPDELGTLIFNMQDNQILLNDKVYLKLEDINKLSIFKNGYQIAFTIPFGRKAY